MNANTLRRLSIAACAVAILHLSEIVPTPAAAQSASFSDASLNDLQLDPRDRLVLESLVSEGELDGVAFEVLHRAALMSNGLPAEPKLLMGMARIYSDAFPGDIEGASRGLAATLEAIEEHRLLLKLIDDPYGKVGKLLLRAETLNNRQEFAEARWLLFWAHDDLSRLVYDDPEEFRRLIDASILQARIEYRPDDAIKVELMKLRLSRQGFSGLLNAQRRYVEQGHLQDIRFDVLVSLGLNRELVKMARTTHDRSIALNELANSLRSLGEMEQGTEHLEEAILAYRAALKNSDLFSDPRDWATSQHNLGYALWLVATRDQNASSLFLAQSVDAYRAALGYRSREQDARAWGLTQNNLGVSLFDLAKVSRGTQELILAIEAFNATLGVFDPQESVWKVAASNLKDANDLLVRRNASN